MEEQNSGGGEQGASVKMDVRPVTHFQLVSENGGFVLVMGTRSLKISQGKSGQMPDLQLEPFVAAFLSHVMLKDLTRIFATALSQFETAHGVIPVPGSPAPPGGEASNSKAH
jgi:hypothetical protein